MVYCISYLSPSLFVTYVLFCLCWFRYSLIRSSAYRISFHISGTPGRHQWLQSWYLNGDFLSSGVRFCFLYIEGWPSFRKSVILVTFWYVTRVFMFFSTFSKTIILSGYSVRYFSFSIGSVSLSHCPPEFHCPPLQFQNFLVMTKSSSTIIIWGCSINVFSTNKWWTWNRNYPKISKMCLN